MTAGIPVTSEQKSVPRTASPDQDQTKRARLRLDPLELGRPMP